MSAASIIVVKNSTVVLHEGFGAKPDAVYLLASISKPVNAVGLMVLVERGLVSLDDPRLPLPARIKGRGPGANPCSRSVDAHLRAARHAAAEYGIAAGACAVE